MRIGWDIDGVLANFDRSAAEVLKAVSGRNLLPPDFDEHTSPTWHWPQHFGYSESEVKALWDAIAIDPDFWANLEEVSGMETLRCRWRTLLAAGHDMVFATARLGKDPLIQTKYWLHKHGCSYANVTITKEKGQFCADYFVDAYIDDRLQNIQDVVRKSPATRAYLLNRLHNAAPIGSGYIRVPTIEEFLRLEGI